MKRFLPLIRSLVVLLVLAGIIYGGYHFWPRRAAAVTEQGDWTCSMHPQIRMPRPGQCPICGMNLIPVKDQ